MISTLLPLPKKSVTRDTTSRYHGDLAVSAVFLDCKFIKNATFDAWACTE